MTAMNMPSAQTLVVPTLAIVPMDSLVTEHSASLEVNIQLSMDRVNKNDVDRHPLHHDKQ